MYKMKNVLHKNNFNLGTVHVYVDPPPIQIIEINNDEKLDKVCIKIKFPMDPTSANLDLYGFKMYLFYSREMEEFLLLISNFNMTLEASGTLVAIAKIKYIGTTVRGDMLPQFDTFSAEVGITTSEKLKSVILVLVTYCFPVNSMSKKTQYATE